MLLLVSQKSPQTNPLQVSQRGPYGEKYWSTGHLHISERPNKNSSNRKALRKKRPSMFDILPHYLINDMIFEAKK